MFEEKLGELVPLFVTVHGVETGRTTKQMTIAKKHEKRRHCNPSTPRECWGRSFVNSYFSTVILLLVSNTGRTATDSIFAVLTEASRMRQRCRFSSRSAREVLLTNDDCQITNDKLRNRSRPEAVNGYHFSSLLASIRAYWRFVSFRLVNGYLLRYISTRCGRATNQQEPGQPQPSQFPFFSSTVLFSLGSPNCPYGSLEKLCVL